jgi:TonB family protein
MSGFHTPLPLPEEEGILVNFGYDETGSGLIEPSAAQSEPAASQSTPAVATSETAEDIPAVQSNLTQEFEEAPEVVKQVQKPDPEAERKRQQEIEAERIRQQQLEAERIKRAQEEAEQKKIREEQERIAREEAERKARIEEINNRTRNALNNSNAAGTGTATNQGNTTGTGNQGAVTGSVDSNVYGDGIGTGTRGVSANLAGRTPTKLPSPTYDIQSEGIVVVEVTVDRNGNVTNAEPGVKGTTTLEEYFLRVAKEAALAAKFDAKPDAPIFQKGTITYHFKLR